MILEGCQGKSNNLTITEKICPQCGNEIELFSIDVEMKCDKCGFVVRNDAASCAQWCQYAQQCLGEQLYKSIKDAGSSSAQR